MKTSLFALALGAVLPGLAQASTLYDPGLLRFETQDRQSVWGAGAAAELSGTYFAGAEWDERFEVGDIVGKVTQTNIPDVTFSTRLAAWNACKDSWFSDLCGSKPTDGSFTIRTDTRTGAEAEVTTSGKAGFDLNYKLSAGSFGATVDYGAEAELPDEIKAGEAFRLQTRSVFSDGTINSQSPTAEASVDAVLKIEAAAKATGCITFLGCATGQGTFLSVDEDRELVGIDPNQITYLDGFTPGWAELKTSLANQSATLKLGVVNGVPTAYVDAPFVPPPPGVGAGVDLGQVTVNVPIFNENGGKVGDALEVKAQADFLDVTADLDTLFGLPGGASASFGPLGVSLDAYDFDAGPSLDVFQDLKLTPTLKVLMEFSEEVEINGKLERSFSGLWESLPEMKIFKPTTFMPKFFVDAVLESRTGLQIGLELSMDFLKATLGLSAFNVTLLELGVGPLFKKDLAFEPDWAKFALFDKTFDVGGFNMVHGQSFTLGANLAPVPLPAGVWMLLAGLGALGLARRRGGYSAAGSALT